MKIPTGGASSNTGSTGGSMSGGPSPMMRALLASSSGSTGTASSGATNPMESLMTMRAMGLS